VFGLLLDEDGGKKSVEKQNAIYDGEGKRSMYCRPLWGLPMNLCSRLVKLLLSFYFFKANKLQCRRKV